MNYLQNIKTILIKREKKKGKKLKILLNMKMITKIYKKQSEKKPYFQNDSKIRRKEKKKKRIDEKKKKINGNLYFEKISSIIYNI